MEITIERLNGTMLGLLPREQEPFWVIGRLVPRYDGISWSTQEELLDTPRKKTYPDDGFDPMEYVGQDDRAAFVALRGGACVGVIRVSRRWNGNAWVEDLAVSEAARGMGIGTMLMDAAVAWGRGQGLYGAALETQDWNLLACRFYLKYGFTLGGMDQNLYGDGPCREESALYFYLLPQSGGEPFPQVGEERGDAK